ncbi:MAG: baseplate protein [Deltaproteobacteria bacterium]|nr:MAG: baseplate protein [Deltaproteobacteria bacterium]
MAKETLGVGWKFPCRINERGGVAVSLYEEKVKESIRIILGTAKGERVMRPEFGCGIHDFVFSTIDTSTLTLIRSSVKEALITWEPRIEVLDVDTSTERISEGLLMIRIDYRIRATNTEFNLVFPFYLKPGG